MRILVDVGSLLLGRALQQQLAKEPEGYEISSCDAEAATPFIPDFIIADCHTIQRQMALPQKECKIILLDYGLGEAEISALILAHKIDGILSPTTDLILFKKAVRAISQGQIWIDNSKVKALVHHAEAVNGINTDGGLSKKERDIVIHISKGMTNKEIASILCISEQTVKTHISRIFRKMNVSRRSQLVPLAMKLRITNAA